MRRALALLVLAGLLTACAGAQATEPRTDCWIADTIRATVDNQPLVLVLRGHRAGCR